jgi:hypothetical protein
MPLVFFNIRRFKCLKRRILFFSVYIKRKILRCFDFYFDIIQIKYTSFLAFANDVYLILLFMSRYNHAAFKQTTYIIFEYLKKKRILKNA